uniref:Uncharacterized protein n=1 Tax=Astatotilapia calliptera TaxID=8154 RepID=A0AAX7V202_ASTCA
PSADQTQRQLVDLTQQRRTPDDVSGKKLVMRTVKIKEESSKMMVEVIVIITHLSSKLLVNYSPVLNCSVLFTYEHLIIFTYELIYLSFLVVRAQTGGKETWSNVTDLTDKLSEIKHWSTFAVGSHCKSYALSLYSGSHGENWKFGELFNTVSVECEMAELSKDHIYCKACNENGYRVEAVSDDNGHIFTIPQPGNKLDGSIGGRIGRIREKNIEIYTTVGKVQEEKRDPYSCCASMVGQHENRKQKNSFAQKAHKCPQHNIVKT